MPPEPYEVAVLPWGATEAHNRHLPYATDTIQAEAIAAEAARRGVARGARVMVLPGVPFGANAQQREIPFTVNMNPSTQMVVLRDIVESLEVQGVPKLVIVNGHGGNDFRQMIRELQPDFDVFICTANPYHAVDPGDYFDVPGDHAGEMETSLMMHLAPDLVQPLETAGPGAARRFTVTALREGWAWAPRDWLRVTDDTGVGDPAAATAEKGARYFDAVTEKMATFFVELAQTDITDLYG